MSNNITAKVSQPESLLLMKFTHLTCRRLDFAHAVCLQGDLAEQLEGWQQASW